MNNLHQTGLTEVLHKYSKLSMDQANRSVRTIEENLATELAKKFCCRLYDIYLTCLKNGIWPKRYLRNNGMISLADQQTLIESQVTVIGAGGLGGTLILLLARTGIGNLVVSDYDIFDETNLNRQAVSDLASLGQSKSQSAFKMIQAINPSINVRVFDKKINHTNSEELLAGSDLVVDALDNVQDRLTLAKTAKNCGIPYIYGAIAGFMGQVMTIFPEDEGLRLIYGDEEYDAHDPNRSEAVLGVPAVTPSLVASFQAMEVIKVLLGRGRVLRNAFLHIDLESMQLEEFSIA